LSGSLTDTLTEILPVPGNQIITSIGPLINNKQGLEREADNEGFAESGFIGFQLADKLLSYSKG